jgi:Protein of unknown function (DUF3309)
MSVGTILLIILLLLIVGAIPSWGYNKSWGYGPSGGLGLLLVVVIVLMLMGRIYRACAEWSCRIYAPHRSRTYCCYGGCGGCVDRMPERRGQCLWSLGSCGAPRRDCMTA